MTTSDTSLGITNTANQIYSSTSITRGILNHQDQLLSTLNALQKSTTQSTVSRFTDAAASAAAQATAQASDSSSSSSSSDSKSNQSSSSSGSSIDLYA
jgi:hypothetical protein